MKSITAARQPLQPTRTPVATTLIIIIVENRLETSFLCLLLIKIDWYPSAVDALLVVGSWCLVGWLAAGWMGIRSIDRRGVQRGGSDIRFSMIRQITTTANLLNISFNYIYFLPKNLFLSHKNHVFSILIRKFTCKTRRHTKRGKLFKIYFRKCWENHFSSFSSIIDSSISCKTHLARKLLSPSVYQWLQVAPGISEAKEMHHGLTISHCVDEYGMDEWTLTR